MDNKVGIPWGCTIFNSVMTAIQSEDILRMICLILTAISTLISIITSIMLWYKKAKADGKITIDELEELKNISEEGKKQIQTIINKEKESNKDE